MLGASQSIPDKGCDWIHPPLLMEDSWITSQGSYAVWLLIGPPKEYLINAYFVSDTIPEAGKPDKGRSSWILISSRGNKY